MPRGALIDLMIQAEASVDAPSVSGYDLVKALSQEDEAFNKLAVNAFVKTDAIKAFIAKEEPELAEAEAGAAKWLIANDSTYKNLQQRQQVVTMFAALSISFVSFFNHKSLEISSL